MSDFDELDRRLRESAARYLAEQGLDGPDLGEVGLAALRIYVESLLRCAREDFGRAIHGKDPIINPRHFQLALDAVLAERSRGLIERN